MSDRTHRQSNMPVIASPPRDADLLGAISVHVQATLQSYKEEPETIALTENVICHVDSWESEIVWQVVRAIGARQGFDIAREALENAMTVLNSHESGN